MSSPTRRHAPLHLGGETALVVELDVTELAAEASVLRCPAQALEFLEVIFPGVSQVMGE
jgi:hypothetical protein